MLVLRDLGFWCLFLVLLLFTVFAFVVRRKWRHAVAREAEIRRLLVLASEEASRVELEASAEYSAVLFSPPLLLPQCAVCYSPTTSRCSRCKAVRYCSGKCQIIHWRQGHKDQCHPPSTDIQNGHHRVVKQEFLDSYVPEGGVFVKSAETSSKEPAFTNPSPSSEVFPKEDDSTVYHPPLDRTARAHISKSSSTSVSIDSAPSLISISPATGASLKNSSSDCSGRSIGPQRADVSSSRRSTPTHTDPVDSHASVTGFGVEETKSESATSSDSEIGTPEAHPLKENLASSRFRDADDEKSNHSGSGEGILRFSFNLSGNATSPFPHGSKPKPIDGAASSEKCTNGASKFKAMPSSNCPIELRDAEPRGVSSLLSSESRPTASGTERNAKEALDHGYSPMLSSKRSEHVSGMSSTIHIMKPRKMETLGTGASKAHPSSENVQRSLSSGKSGKVNNDLAGIPSSMSAPNSLSGSSRYPPNVGNGLKTSMLKVVDHIRPSKLSKQYQGLFPYELFVKLYNWKKVEFRPCGLTNCGNSCYANVVLQCLAFTPPLTAYFLQGFHSRACGRSDWCFTCEFEILILKAKDGKSPLSPVGILSQFGRINSNLVSGKEEDAHEFLRYVIDVMQSICIKEAAMNELKPSEEETTFIGLTFGGFLRSKIRCMKCRGKSERHERFMDLTLEIEGDIGSLEEALRKFTGTEILDGENKYKCSRCKSYEKAKKKFTVLEAPNVLTIALKRFQSGKFGKLNKSIRFPEILNLAPYMSGTSDKLPIYSLYGVVVHLDIMNAAFSGHYVCYVKNNQNKWFKIDDSAVKAVERERVLGEGAYMLLYARCLPRAPRSIRDTVLNEARPNPSSTPWCHPAWVPSVESRFRWVFDTDSSSDNSSLISGSDEGSCCTESTRDSSSTDDFSEYLFGESGHGWSSPYKGSSSELDAPLSSSPASVAALGPGEGIGIRSREGSGRYDGDTCKPFRRLASSGSGGSVETDPDVKCSRLGR